MLGMILRGDVLQAAAQILSAAEDGAGFAEAGGRDVHRLAEMADDVAAHVGRAALRSVQKRHRAFDSAQRQAGAQRRTELARVPGRDIVGRRCRLLKDVQARATLISALISAVVLALIAIAFRLRGVSFHTGLITVEYTSRAKFTMPANPARASLRS